MSSDEDLPIFHRALKTPTSDEEKDLVNTIKSQSYSDLLKPTNLSELTDPKVELSTGSNVLPTDNVSLDSNILNSLSSAQFPALDEIENILMQSAPSKSEAVSTVSESFITPVKENQSNDTGKNRPRSAETPVMSSKKLSPPVPIKNSWVQGDNNLVVNSENNVGETNQKSKEVPELNSKIQESKMAEKQSPLKMVTKNKTARKSRSSEAFDHTETKDVVSQYFVETPSITLESVDLGNYNMTNLF